MLSTAMRRSKNTSKKFTPKKHQEKGIKWIVDRPYCGLFWTPGTGKTSTVLHAFRNLSEKDEIESVLVVANKRIADKVWSDEIAKWGLPFRVSKILGPPKRRMEALQREAEVYVTNYENLPWLCGNWEENNFGQVMLVCDESTKLKHTQTKRFKALRKYLNKFARRVILTGTPIPNGMHDLFGQMYIVDRGESLGKFITHFRNQFFHPVGYMGYQWELDKGADEEIYDLIQDKIYRYEGEDGDLPDLNFVSRNVQLPYDAWKQYVQMEKEFVVDTNQGTIVAANAAAATAKLRQMANGSVYKTENDEDLIDIPKNERRTVVHAHSEKVLELVELLEELQGKPALVAYEFTHDRLAIEKAVLKSGISHLLPKKNGKPFVPYIGGGTKDRDANKYIDWWNAGSLPVLLGHPASVAHGLNMQETSAVVIYFSLTYNLEHYEQFYKRVHRQGQKEPVFVYHIVAEDTIDEDIMSALKAKDCSQRALLSAMLKRSKLNGY